MNVQTENSVLRACPRERSPLVQDIDFRKLLNGDGDRSSSLVLELSTPVSGFTTVKFDPISIEVTESFFNRKCKVSINRIAYASPLMAMGQHEQQPVRAALAIYRRNSIGGVFSNTVKEVLDASKAYAPVPGEALVMAGKVGETLNSLGNTMTDGVDTFNFLLGADSNGVKGTHSWTIKSFDRSLRDPIVITVSLKTKDHLFDPTGGTWDPASILARSFYATAPGAAQTIRGYLLSAASSEYSTFNAATNPSVAEGACSALFNKVDQMGLTPRDTRILKWALIRSHNLAPAYRQMDHLSCMSGVWVNLPKTTKANNEDEMPEEFVQRPVVLEVENRATSFIEQSSALSDEDAFAAFFKNPSFVAVASKGEALFPGAFDYTDTGAIGVLQVNGRKMGGASDWAAFRWSDQRALAQNIGCYSYRKDQADIPDGEVLALGNFNTGSDGTAREALVRIVFAEVVKDGPPQTARIKAIEIIGSPTADQLRPIKKRHQTKCGDSWSPALLQ